MCIRDRSYAMVGFRLRNTVTANGSVSRGVCTERNGMLESITERTHIEPVSYTHLDVYKRQFPRWSCIMRANHVRMVCLEDVSCAQNDIANYLE